MSSVVEQLLRFYAGETWHEKRLTEEQARAYYETVLRRGRIYLCVEGEKVLGYAEAWRMTLGDFGKFISGEPWDVAVDNIEHGPICFVNSIFVDMNYRSIGVLSYLKRKVMEGNGDAEYIIGHRASQNGKMKVYKRPNVKEGVV